MLHTKNVNFKDLTSFQYQGIAPNVIMFKSLSKLKEFIKEKTPYLILGKGSNSIVKPNSGKKPIIRLSNELFGTVIKNNQLTVSAGTAITRLMAICQKEGLSGCEFCAGVPATVGGMVTMNFGCWGQSIADIIDTVHILNENGEEKWLTHKELEFSYRHSIIQEQDWIVLQATFKLNQKDPSDVTALVKKNIQERLTKQPLRERTFGSIFKNPKGDYAARLIEASGLKGFVFKSVKISEKHANFMVNLNDATYEDIIEFIALIKTEVKAKQGVDLKCEVHIYA